MKTSKHSRFLTALLALPLIVLPLVASGETDLSRNPISSASSTEIKPNILFIMDDSYSMDWDYLPDWANVHPLDFPYQRFNADFNGVAYNPTVTYTPPSYPGEANAGKYPSQSKTATSNWTAVKKDGFGVQFQDEPPTTKNLTGGTFYSDSAFYYTVVPGEFCTDLTMKNCSTTQSAIHHLPASLRWCNTAANAVAEAPDPGSCQAIKIDGTIGSTIAFNYPRIPAPRVSTLSLTGSGAVTSIKVDGNEILSASSNPATLSDIAARINACTYSKTGSCEIVGFSAKVNGSSVILSAPIVPSNAAPSVTPSGVLTTYPFAKPATNLAPGENLMTVITSTTTTYPKASSRIDCAADPCTYDEEMENYANWYAYYRTRMQAMKTAASRSFEPIDDKYRIGYYSINNNTGTDFQNISDFDDAQKQNWYDKLFAAKPIIGADTPLRIALANAGRLYAGELNGLTLNTVPVEDPMQFYCQLDVSILSTDGYWNMGPGFKIDGVSLVDDQDGPGLEERPYLDGGAGIELKTTLQWKKEIEPTLASWHQSKTEQWQSRTLKWQERTYDKPMFSTSALQSRLPQRHTRTYQLQMKTRNVWHSWGGYSVPTQHIRPLQKSTGPLQYSDYQLQTREKNVTKTQTAHLQSQTGIRKRQTNQLQQRITPVQRSTDYGMSWSNVSECTQDRGGSVQCRFAAAEAWAPVSSCTVQSRSPNPVYTGAGTDSERTTYYAKTECQYEGWSTAEVVSSCTNVSMSTSSPYTVGKAVSCSTDLAAEAWQNVDSCTPDVDTGLSCRYAPYSAWEVVDSCTAVPPSASAPYTVPEARQCQFNQWTGWTDTNSACTATSTVGCQYRTVANWTATDSCTPQNRSTGASFAVTQAHECRVNYGAWTTVDACEVVNTGSTQTQCQYADNWSDDFDSPGGVCTAKGGGSGPAYVGPLTECGYRWVGTDTVVTTCNPAVETCTTTWSGWYDVGSCTATTTTDAETTPGSVQCQYVDKGELPTESCTPLAQSVSPNYTVGVARECRSTWPFPWEYVATCDAVTDFVQCQYESWTPLQAGACPNPPNGLPQSTGPHYTVTTASECSIDWGAYNDVAGPTCTNVPGVKECQKVEDVTWTNDLTYDPLSPPSPDPMKEYRAVRVGGSASVADGFFPPVPNATPTNPAPTNDECVEGTVNGLTTSCRDKVPGRWGPGNVADCVAEAASSSAIGVETRCTKYETGPDPIPEGQTCIASGPLPANNYTATFCHTGEGKPTPDTLADVAEYYFIEDLRIPARGKCGVTSPDLPDGLCTNSASVPRQFMSTYTLGLGVSGVMQYQSNYQTALTGDYKSIYDGVSPDPASGVCSWQERGECNWPKPISDKQTTVDDLWHAAVNGRGKYFSASNPADVAAGISDALQDVTAKEGSLASVTVSNPNMTAAGSETSSFGVSFSSGTWTGDLVKYNLAYAGGALVPTKLWSARSLLDSKVASVGYLNRKVYTYDPAAKTLISFLYDNLGADKPYFELPHIQGLSQMCTTGTVCLTDRNSAQKDELVNFLRGDRANEGSSSTPSKYFRERTNLLGDIVHSEAVYVQKSPWSYGDTGHSDFKADTEDRVGMVYVGANDGMLHAFYSEGADGGQEAWAYVPRFLFPTLYRLADKSYAGMHEFYVDATPVTGDVCLNSPASTCTASEWKTILVGGANRGGKGYYALDITDPENPKALWEFTDTRMGYTYGNPLITKLLDGTWVVMVTSGYNNADGQGYLFVLRASDGGMIGSAPIATTGSGGTSANPSGLAKINGWVNNVEYNNSVLRVYGGDLLGNLWRFDVNDIIAPAGREAQRLATLKDPDGNPQPITTRPELGMVKYKPVIFVGTGQLLGTTDLTTTGTQSIYGIKDRLEASDYGNPRDPASTYSFVQQKLVYSAGDVCAPGMVYCPEGKPKISFERDIDGKQIKNPVDWATDDGWYVDFPVGGERANTDIVLVQGTLVVVTNTPQSGACVPAGSSNIYFLDYRTGGFVDGLDNAGYGLSDNLSSGPELVFTPDGGIKSIVQGDTTTGGGPAGGGGFGGASDEDTPTNPDGDSIRRISWRELIIE
ncbi:hypothetical protein AGMMS50256_10090 [Betaproteobacteria bacterium]|nr:hypothetical protein AGMMS50256_10090 [Betaproteobacteria bacterium]